MNVTLISDLPSFLGLAREWNALLDSSSQCPAFLCHEWLRTWWEVYGKGRGLYVLLCRTDGEGRLVGALPGYVRVRPSIPKLRELRLMGSEGIISDYLEPLVESGREDEVYSALFDYMTATRDWDIASLDDVPSSSLFIEHLHGRRDLDLAARILDNDKRCPYIFLPDDWEAYCASRSAAMRRRIRRYRRYVAERGDVVVERISDPASLQEAIPDVVSLHQQRKEEVGLEGRFRSEDYLRFHSKIMSLYRERGALLLSFLTVDGKRIAFYYGFQFADRVFVFQSGFDPEWSSLSVSFVLLSHLIENAIREGVKYVDFLRGHEAFKYDWTSLENRLLDISLYRNEPAVRLFRCERYLLDGTRGLAKRILPVALRDRLRRISSGVRSRAPRS